MYCSPKDCGIWFRSCWEAMRSVKCSVMQDVSSDMGCIPERVDAPHCARVDLVRPLCTSPRRMSHSEQRDRSCYSGWYAMTQEYSLIKISKMLGRLCDWPTIVARFISDLQMPLRWLTFSCFTCNNWRIQSSNIHCIGESPISLGS